MSMKISKYLGWRVRLGLLLVVLAGILYFVNFILFHDPHELEFLFKYRHRFFTHRSSIRGTGDRKRHQHPGKEHPLGKTQHGYRDLLQ